MRLARYSVRNFRRLEDVTINLEDSKTVFVGANNAGKTSATAIFKLFTQKAQFKIHDFSAGLMKRIDALAMTVKGLAAGDMPSIDLDIWFTVGSKTEYGRLGFLMPALSRDVVEVGLRLRFGVADLDLLLKEYDIAFPSGDSGRRKSLTHFLGIDGNLRQHFSITYYQLRIQKTNQGAVVAAASSPEVEAEITADTDVKTVESIAKPLDPKDGRATLNSLLRVDYVDAQRNIDDEASSRSNQLSSVFYDFYTSNLKELPNDAAALQVIEKSNTDLTLHYETEFVSLMEIISELGYPSLNDRGLKVISNLSPEKALGGNALLSYQDPDSDHSLPEAYNGLGFKNLVYIAIQIVHFQIQWSKTSEDRPLCHLIFIEEPEVHLHVQVQQTFLNQINKIIKKTSEKTGINTPSPQLVITTHSSHIVSVAEFKEVRYFKKIVSADHSIPAKIRNSASRVLNLAQFNEIEKDEDNINFLKKFVALPHCDLFFADGAIMVEGTVERLLIPQIIQRDFPSLLSRYITTLQLGGAYAHRFTSLLKFLGLPCLIITDLDSVDPAKRQSTCIAGHPTAVTANASIKELLLDAKNKKKNDEKYKLAKTISSLNKLKLVDKIKNFGSSTLMVAFQEPVSMPSYGASVVFIPRTFEESFIFHNITYFHEGKLRSEIDFDDFPDALVDYYKIHSGIHSDFAKVDFVLSILSSDQPWVTPGYCADGLNWLKDILG